jgi:hypothetical protein
VAIKASLAGLMSTVNEIQRALGVGLVLLYAVGQAHRNECCLLSLRAQALHRQLRHASGSCGIDAPADTEHIGLAFMLGQVLRQESDTRLGLLRRIAFCPYSQRFDDFLMYWLYPFAHHPPPQKTRLIG